MLCLLAIVVLTGADLLSKQWALDKLSEPSPLATEPVCEPNATGRVDPQRRQLAPVVLVDGYLEFRYAENCGAAFGFMRDMPSLVRKSVFYLAASGAVVLLLFMFASGRGGPLFAWSVPLIVAGALGNLVDRVNLGYVVDFVRFHLNDRWAYPTFNLADAFISVGVGLILIDGFFEGRREREREEAAQLAE